MTDYISREAIIQFGETQLKHLDDGEAYRRLDAWLNFAPAADVRPAVRGKWTTEHLASTSGGTYAVVRCSECFSQFPMWHTNFCPNCGADMREEQT